MSVTSSPLDSSSEPDNPPIQRAHDSAGEGVGRYAIHLGLLMVALAVWFSTRLDLN